MGMSQKEFEGMETVMSLHRLVILMMEQPCDLRSRMPGHKCFQLLHDLPLDSLPHEIGWCLSIENLSLGDYVIFETETVFTIEGEPKRCQRKGEPTHPLASVIKKRHLHHRFTLPSLLTGLTAVFPRKRAPIENRTLFPKCHGIQITAIAAPSTPVARMVAPGESILDRFFGATLTVKTVGKSRAEIPAVPGSR
jgi:hypothetical protein